MEKKILRRQMMDMREALVEKDKKQRDLVILNKLLESKFYKKSKVIFTYIGYGSEIDTKKYIEKFLEDKKVVCVPRTNYDEKYMDAVVINSTDNLYKDKYGILEPGNDIEPINKGKIDLVILPGLAFDNRGGRLGYGGGYYDKYLSTMPKDIVKIGLCYDFQIIREVPTEEHDIFADCVISDKK